MFDELMAHAVLHGLKSRTKFKIGKGSPSKDKKAKRKAQRKARRATRRSNSKRWR